MKERNFGHVVRPFLLATALPVFAGCANQVVEQSPEISHTTYVRLYTLTDRNNPVTNSGEPMFANIPDFVKGPPQDSLQVLSTDWFYAYCDFKQVYGKDKADTTTKGLNKDEWDRQKMKKVELKIGEKVIDKIQAPNNETFIGGAGDMIRAAQLPVGKTIVICSFETWGGTKYTSEAPVEVTDNRT